MNKRTRRRLQTVVLLAVVIMGAVIGLKSGKLYAQTTYDSWLFEDPLYGPMCLGTMCPSGVQPCCVGGEVPK